ncbi:hypothetical protein OK016_24355 [Vibrio chagasii]|nr:hypothetical protein [Vibrio chagasii]
MLIIKTTISQPWSNSAMNWAFNVGFAGSYSYKHDGSIGHWGVDGRRWLARKLQRREYAGQTPVNMLAWSKEAPGFLKPTVLSRMAVSKLTLLREKV